MHLDYCSTQALQLLNALPCAVGYKNKDSVYLGGNQLLASYMGYATPKHIVGLTDHDIKHEMANLANEYICQDKEVLKYGPKQHIDIGRYANGDLHIHLSTKKPLYNHQNEIIGTVFTCTELTPMALAAIYKDLLNENEPGFFAIGGQYESYQLRPRESECLFYLLRGYTAKEIAKRLTISSKTVEYHIEQLKNKWSCDSRAQLIEQAMALGFIFNIPLSLLASKH